MRDGGTSTDSGEPVAGSPVDIVYTQGRAMASWNENKVVGVVAGVVVIGCVAFFIMDAIRRRRPAPISPETKAQMERVMRQMRQAGDGREGARP